jgi:hypothetical protein
MSTTLYRIVDEPQPSRLESMAVRPYFPLLASMLGGVIVAWPWFVVNALALGSTTRRREIGVVVLGFLGIAAYAGVYITLYTHRHIPDVFLPYAPLPLIVWKLAITYWLFELQERAAELRAYFGAKLRNGLGVVAIAFFAREYVVASSLPLTFRILYWLVS